MSDGFNQFCIVELFGHQQVAGKVSEQTIAGQGFVRIDIPKTSNREAFTRFFGASAIYSMTPVSEAIAQQAAENILAEPVMVYLGIHRQLEQHTDDDGADIMDDSDQS